MTTEQMFFIQAVSDFINQKKTTNIPMNLDVAVLNELAKKHEVQAIIYYQTKLRELLKGYSSTLYISTNRKSMLQKVISSFDFPYFILKGGSVSKLYPIPEFRTMGDIDLVVHTENREMVHNILLSQGYQNVSKQDDREWQYYKNGMEFELHDHLVYTEAINNKIQESFFNNFWHYVSSNNELDWNFHFLFLFSHLRKHFMNEGCGFRHFMDIAIVAKYKDLDWNWIEKKAEEIELINFLRTVLAFCNRWFGTTTPIATSSLDDEFFEEATNKIFEDGIFGFSNELNDGSAAANLYLKGGKCGQVNNALQKIFPSYKSMIMGPHYSFLKGKPYLLPAAWIYRAFRGRKKTNIVLGEVKKSFTSAGTISKRKSMYDQWGL